jgi:hypothetical protein
MNDLDIVDGFFDDIVICEFRCFDPFNEKRMDFAQKLLGLGLLL